jgi:hypothetical protein
MKYLKLFEAFDSQTLSKTLGFIKEKSQKRDFLNLIKRVCDQIDFPLSKLNDDFFEYLPFSAALKKSDMTGDETCDARSEVEFPEYPVEGEVCKGGKLERKWGRGVREVECPVCRGASVKPKKPELKLLKFWFDKDGNFITTTAVDGLVAERRGEPKGGTETRYNVSFSDVKSDYQVLKTNLNFNEIRELITGDIVYFENREGHSGVAYVYVSSRNAVYFLQNFAEGSTPNGDSWKSIAPYGWVIASTSDFRRCDLLGTGVKQPETEVTIDPYTWNTQVSNQLRVVDRSIFDQVKNANFAIILDFGKLKKSGYEAKGDIISGREERKSGATALISAADIKKQNINRYMQEIAKRSDILSDVSNINKVAKRMLGGNLALFLIGSNSRFNRLFTDLIDYYYQYIQYANEGNHDGCELTQGKLSNTIKSNYELVSLKTTLIGDNLKNIKDEVSKDPDANKDYIKIVEKLEKISQIIYTRFSSINLETIEDLEIFASKIEAVRNLTRNERYEFYRLRSFLDYIDAERTRRPYEYLVNYYNIREKEVEILKSLDILERLVKSLI